MWVLTVASLTNSAAAISVLESPRAISCSTSRSQLGVCCAERAGVVDEGDGLHSCADAQLVERVLDVLVHGAGADADRGRDALCREPFSD